MTTPIIEPVYAGEYVLSEGPRSRSRDQVTIGASQTLLAGTVLGYSSVGALAIAIAALGTNVGNATFGTESVAAGTPPGEYDLTMDDATHFTVLQPPAGADEPGEVVGHGVLGTAFNVGGLTFTGTAGGTACVAGDAFKITVSQSGALDEYVRFNPAATDGSQNAAAINFAPVTTASGVTAQALAHTRDIEAKGGVLDWGGADDGQITAGIAQLAKHGIIVR
jgi:hypothetical protein